MDGALPATGGYRGHSAVSSGGVFRAAATADEKSPAAHGTNRVGSGATHDGTDSGSRPSRESRKIALLHREMDCGRGATRGSQACAGRDRETWPQSQG